MLSESAQSGAVLPKTEETRKFRYVERGNTEKESEAGHA